MASKNEKQSDAISQAQQDSIEGEGYYRRWTDVWDSWTDVFLSKGQTFNNFQRLNRKTYANETNSIWSHFYSSITAIFFRFLN